MHQISLERSTSVFNFSAIVIHDHQYNSSFRDDTQASVNLKGKSVICYSGDNFHFHFLKNIFSKFDSILGKFLIHNVMGQPGIPYFVNYFNTRHSF